MSEILDSVSYRAHPAQDEEFPFMAGQHIASRAGQPYTASSKEDKSWNRPRNLTNVGRSCFVPLPRKACTSWNDSPYFKQIILFLAVEVAFLLLATVARFRVLWVPEATNEHVITLTRGSFNIIFIAWQTLALAPLLAIVNFVYSSEWYYIYRRDHNGFTPGTTELISSLNGGWFGRARYLMLHRPSNAFRFTFVAALLCTTLTGVGPSVFSLLPSAIPYDGVVEIANITTLGELARESANSFPPAAIMQAANLLVSDPDPNQPQYFIQYWSLPPPWELIPQPSQPVPPHVNATYISDIIKYHHTCEWHIPTWNMADGGDSTVLDGQSYWTVTAFPEHRWGPWMPSNLPQDAAAGVFPLTELITAGNSLASTAFLFLGTNASLSQSIALDLQHTPSLYRDDGFPLRAAQRDTSSIDGGRTPRLASILICDPSPQSLRALVHAAAVSGGTQLTWEGIEGGPVGNSPPDVAAALMSSTFKFGCMLNASDAADGTFVGSLPRVAILNSNGTGRYYIYSSPREIADALDGLFNMISGPVMNGYIGPDITKSTFASSSPRFIEVERLTVNTLFFAATCGLTGVITVLLTIAANLPSAKYRRPLRVKTILETASQPLIDTRISRSDHSEDSGDRQ